MWTVKMSKVQMAKLQQSIDRNVETTNVDRWKYRKQEDRNKNIEKFDDSKLELPKEDSLSKIS